VEILGVIDYIKNTYGQCKVYDPKVKDSCECMKNWKGTLCPNWLPVEWNSFEEAIKKAKDKYKHADENLLKNIQAIHGKEEGLKQYKQIMEMERKIKNDET
jgi:hypothetical protein